MTYYLVIVGTLDNPLYESVLYSARVPPMSLSGSTASVSSPSHSSFSIFNSPSAPSGPSFAASGVKSNVSYGPKTGRHVMQLVAHASMDVIEDVQWHNNNMYLKSIDRFHEWTVSAWVTPGGIKLILLHDLKQDDGIRIFLHECWEAYVKHLLNPFNEFNTPISSPAFDAKIKSFAKKNL